MLRLIRISVVAIILSFSIVAGVLADDGSVERVYIVVAGDTLSGIGERFGVGVDDLMAANELDDPNLIFIGQRLLIPTEGAAERVRADAQIYQVQPGESWAMIARQTGLDLDELLAINGITHRPYLLLEPELQLTGPPAPSFPAPFLDIAYSPAIVQGQTGVVWVTLAEPEGISGSFGNTKLRFFYRDKTRQGYRYEALVPTGALAKPGERILALKAGQGEISESLPILAGDYGTQHIVLPPSKGGLLEPKKLKSELEILQEIWAGVSEERQWRKPFRFPVAEGFERTSPYGTRRSYNSGPVSSYHAGTDWSAPEGTPIVAPANGTVVLAENLDVRGGAVVIDHGQGVYSNFWHQSEILVEPGQQVERGDTIGLVGTTGLSTGAHLHWEVRVNGIAVDPLQWTEVYFPFAPVEEAGS